jgi:hypothetical protein
MRFFRDALFALLISLAFLLLLEGGLRLAHVHYQASFYQSEQERGFSLRPNAAGWNVSENEVYVRINSDGMRDHERPISRPPGTLRVALLGASETEGRQVPLDKGFAAVLNRHLNQALGPSGHPVDVLNFGVNGYTFSQDYLTLHNHVWKYDPQIVVLLLAVPNIQKNTRELFWGDDPRIPFYVLKNGQLVPDELTRAAPLPNPLRNYWKNRIFDLMNCSTLLSLFNEARNKGLEGLEKQKQALRGMLRKSTPSSAASALPGGDVVTHRTYLPDLPETQEAWAIGEAFLELMQQECSDHGAEFWIVTPDEDVQSYPSLAERDRFLREMNLPSLNASDERIRRFADAHGIPVMILGPPMADYAVAHGVALHGFPATPYNSDPWPYATGHWNELGHELAGSLVSQAMLQRSSVIRPWMSPASNPNLTGGHSSGMNQRRVGIEGSGPSPSFPAPAQGSVASRY